MISGGFFSSGMHITSGNPLFGIVSAYGKESKPLRSKLKEIRREEIHTFVSFLLQQDDEEVIVVKSGSGQERGKAASEFLINRYHPKLIINCGVAGAISPHRQIGDVVISEDVIEYDVNTDEAAKRTAYQTDPDLVKTALQASVKSFIEGNIVPGTILSGDSVIDTQEKKEKLWNRYKGECVEQEGAGVARVCQAYHLPWVVIRGISDHADERVLDEFKKNFDRAAQNAAMVTFELMKMLITQNNAKNYCYHSNV